MESQSTSTFMPGHTSAVMEAKGIRFGMEICADHCISALSREITTNRLDAVNLHLILSRTVGLDLARVAKGATIAINCAGDYVQNEEHRENTGVWQLSDDGESKKLEPTTIDRTLVFHNIRIPELRQAQLLRSKL